MVVRLWPGGVWLIVGCPRVGRTMLAAQVARHAAVAGEVMFIGAGADGPLLDAVLTAIPFS